MTCGRSDGGPGGRMGGVVDVNCQGYRLYDMILRGKVGFSVES